MPTARNAPYPLPFQSCSQSPSLHFAFSWWQQVLQIAKVPFPPFTLTVSPSSCGCHFPSDGFPHCPNLIKLPQSEPQRSSGSPTFATVCTIIPQPLVHDVPGGQPGEDRGQWQRTVRTETAVPRFICVSPAPGAPCGSWSVFVKWTIYK